MTLTDLLKEIKELDEKATKGPWDIELRSLGDLSLGEWVITKCWLRRRTTIGDRLTIQAGEIANGEFDVDFVSRAHTLLPKLARVVEYLYQDYALPLMTEDGPEPNWQTEVFKKHIQAILGEGL